VIELEFIGAARTVTGSKHLLKTSQATVLLDCGLFQGHRSEAFEKNMNIPVNTSELDAVVLSHAHIDHSGALPALRKKGYRGPIYSTAATRDLCAPMLMDTAYLMKADAMHIDRLMAGNGHGLKRAIPLYDQSDVSATLSMFVGIPYHHQQQIAPGIKLTFIDAGHVLGSAISILDIQDNGRAMRLAYTGDLGRKHLPILRNPEIPTDVHCLMMESTYGNRLHDPIALTGKTLTDVINRTHQRGGKVIIPSFALERAQEVIYVLKHLRAEKKIPKIPVYVDSPLTVKLTDVFKLHPECYDQETFELLRSRNSPFDFEGLTYVSSSDDSKALDQSPEPAIIISASGMCEGGRILHHLHATIENSKNTILIVGYQAEHTLGRRLVERRPEVKIFGTPHKLQAEVVVLTGFSGHADQAGLCQFATETQARSSLQRIVLVHGEPESQDTLAELLRQQGVPRIDIPTAGEKLRI
jgi:metallo-beta-lactamase family protein